MAIFNFDDFEKNLPDAFRKDKESNNYKLLKVEKHIYDLIGAMFQSIYNILDIDNATGAVLDDYSSRLNVKRTTDEHLRALFESGEITEEEYRKKSDAQYLIRLKSAISKSFSDGTRDSIAKALAFVLSSSTDRIKLVEGEDNSVHIVDLPMSVLFDAGFTSAQIVKMVEDMLPEGVTVATAEFTGTFEFSELYEIDEDNTGFADIEGTMGGSFGLLEA
jgi:hypothetical protein